MGHLIYILERLHAYILGAFYYTCGTNQETGYVKREKQQMCLLVLSPQASVQT